MEQNISQNTNNQANDQALIGQQTQTNADVQEFDHVGEESILEKENDLLSDLFEQSASGKLHNIEDFVSRWTSFGAVQMSSGTMYKLPMKTVNNNLEKLRGLGIVTCNIEMMVMANPPPNLAGMCFLTYTPPYCDNDIDKQLGIGWAYQMQLSGRIHKKMSVAELTVLELKMPLVVPGIGIRDWNLGTMIFSVPHLTGPTNAPQFFVTARYRITDLKVAGVSSVRVQSGRAVSESGFKMSKTLELGSKAAVELGKVPAITSYANTAAWLLRKGADALKFVGFSKPPMTKGSEPRYLQPFHNYAQFGGTGTEMRLGFNIDQGISVMPDGPTNEDEMDLRYVLSRPVLFDYRTVKTSDSYGASIFRIKMSPSSFFYDTEWGGGNPVRQHTYLSYLSRLYGFWRGGFDITVDIGANHFHSGRIAVVLDPLGNGKAIWDNRDMLYQEIWDIKTGSTFTINFPYALENVWNDYDDDCGYIEFFVETPLASSTENTEITLFFSIAGAADYELTAPHQYFRHIVNGSGPSKPTVPAVLGEYKEEEGDVQLVKVVNTVLDPIPIVGGGAVASEVTIVNPRTNPVPVDFVSAVTIQTEKPLETNAHIKDVSTIVPIRTDKPLDTIVTNNVNQPVTVIGSTRPSDAPLSVQVENSVARAVNVKVVPAANLKVNLQSGEQLYPRKEELEFWEGWFATPAANNPRKPIFRSKFCKTTKAFCAGDHRKCCPDFWNEVKSIHEDCCATAHLLDVMERDQQKECSKIEEEENLLKVQLQSGEFSPRKIDRLLHELYSRLSSKDEFKSFDDPDISKIKFLIERETYFDLWRVAERVKNFRMLPNDLESVEECPRCQGFGCCICYEGIVPRGLSHEMSEILNRNFIYGRPVVHRPDLLVRCQGQESGSSIDPSANLIRFAEQTNPTTAHQQAVGDPSQNLRQLLKRYALNTSLTVRSTNAAVFEPFGLKHYDVPWDRVNMDWIDLISPMYAFRRGGMRLIVRGFEKNIDKLECAMFKYFNGAKFTGEGTAGVMYGTQLSWNDFDVLDAYLKFPFAPNITGGIPLEFPYYSKWSRVPFQRYSAAYKTVGQPFEVECGAIIQSSTDNDIRVYRAGADDFNCGFLMGPPCTYAASTTP